MFWLWGVVRVTVKLGLDAAGWDVAGLPGEGEAAAGTAAVGLADGGTVPLSLSAAQTAAPCKAKQHKLAAINPNLFIFFISQHPITRLNNEGIV
jgi:hypothetical protein